MLRGTAMAWCDAITAGKVFDQEQDTQRIRQAFRLLAARSTHWPAPRDFLDALPSPNPVERPLRLVSERSRERGMAAIGEIAARLGLSRGDL